MSDIHNFSPGPAIISSFVRNGIIENLNNFKGSGIGIAELSHRSSLFSKFIIEAEEKILNLCNLSTSHYRVLFLQGGANQQFAMVPMNLMEEGKVAAYIDSGTWGDKAYKASLDFGKSEIVGKSSTYKELPKLEDKFLSNQSNYSYLHITSNNTIYGTQIKELPIVTTPLVVDSSSDIFSKEIDFKKIDLCYASAQKNLGIPGVTIVIIKKELIKDKLNINSFFSYKTHADKNSCFNTPPTLAVLATALTVDWINSLGGIKEIERINREKADCIYKALDSHKCYLPYAKKEDRSIVNITFNLVNDELSDSFAKQAKEKNFLFIHGHRSVGGFRISNYNAQTLESCREIAGFIDDFGKQHS